MSNYSCVVRTNFFRVESETEYRNLIARIYGQDEITLIEKSAPDGNKLFEY